MLQLQLTKCRRNFLFAAYFQKKKEENFRCEFEFPIKFFFFLMNFGLVFIHLIITPPLAVTYYSSHSSIHSSVIHSLSYNPCCFLQVIC